MEKTPFLTTFTATSRQAPSLLIAFCVLTFGSFTALAQGNLKRPISTDKAPKPLTGVYSQGTEARGTMVFCAGQIGQTLEGTFAGDDVVSQLRQAFANIQAVLASANCSLDHVVKITIYLKNMDDFTAMNEAYTAVFKQAGVTTLPARTTVEVARLPRDAKIEIDAIAVKP
jgi:2-iminobutanoate/2-iminopropanoate deaminase